MKCIAAVVLGLVLSVGIAPAEEPGDQQALLALVMQARSRGCAGHAGAASPLRWSDALARAAARIGRGEPSLAAVAKEGFRATRVFQANFSGFRRPADVAGTLAQDYCAALTEPQFTDFGFHREGTSWHVVLAARLQLAELADARAVAAKVLALTNQARTQARRCGDQRFEPAPPLRANLRLERAAAAHAQDMAGHQYVEHVGRDGSTFAQRITRARYEWHSVGENVAAGQRTPEDVVQDWLASPGHCANIMSGDFTEMGVAFAVNLDAKDAVYWAQEFGRPK
jgi:uncharacterized protein YkwD